MAASSSPDCTRAPTPMMPSWMRPFGESGGAVKPSGARKTAAAATVPAALRLMNSRRLSLLAMLDLLMDVTLLRFYRFWVNIGSSSSSSAFGVDRMNAARTGGGMGEVEPRNHLHRTSVNSSFAD